MANSTGLSSPTSPHHDTRRLRQRTQSAECLKSLGSTTSIPRSSARTPARLGKLSTGQNPASSRLPSLTSPEDIITETPEPASSSRQARRSISIANFPRPPSTRNSGGSSRRISAEADLLSEQHGSAAASRANGLRIKKLRTKASTGCLNLAYASSSPISRSSERYDGRTFSHASSHRQSSALASMQSPPHSRSSSAAGSRSTSATTLEEEAEEARHGTKIARHRDSADGREGSGNVLVSVRVRPDLGGASTESSDWIIDGRKALVAYRGHDSGDYYYDNVFTPHDQNHRVYDASAKRLVRRVMEGYHGTVFAYGMTGTGKTFSMQGTRDSPGIIPLAITDIFSYIRETPQREFLLRVSYLEIYNEKINDLLSPSGGLGANQEEIKLREDSKRGVYASPIKEEIVQSPTQLLRVIARGDQFRKTRSTQYNAESSRSHAIAQVVVESRERVPPGIAVEDKRAALAPGGVRVSTLSMIDLAGSERAANDKARQKEGAHINKSLLTLGTVISKLSGKKDKEGNPMDKDGRHLPYRDSKLTRLLQPALSGNSLISILCTIQMSAAGSVAPGARHTIETLNTLKFASRAKNNIVSHAKKAEEAFGSAGDGGSRVLLERYRMEIQELKSQLDSQKKEQAVAKPEVRLEEIEVGIGPDQRHEEQMLEIHLARTALQRRMDDLKRLILSSQSSGVNTSSRQASLNRIQTSQNDSTNRVMRALRSSASQSTLARSSSALSRTASASSNKLAGRTSHSMQRQSSLASPHDISEEEGEDLEDFADEIASPTTHIHALQHDLTERNRYIKSLERQLLEARRSSQMTQSRISSPLSVLSIDTVALDQDHDSRRISAARSSSSTHSFQLLQDRDAEIAELRARLEDKERTVGALKMAARQRNMATPTAGATPMSPLSPLQAQQQSSATKSLSSPFSPTPARWNRNSRDPNISPQDMGDTRRAQSPRTASQRFPIKPTITDHQTNNTSSPPSYSPEYSELKHNTTSPVFQVSATHSSPLQGTSATPDTKQTLLRHKSNSSLDSASNYSLLSSPLSRSHALDTSPLPVRSQKSLTSPAPLVEDSPARSHHKGEHQMRRKHIDEITQILDGMIQDHVSKDKKLNGLVLQTDLKREEKIPPPGTKSHARSESAKISGTSRIATRQRQKTTSATTSPIGGLGMGMGISKIGILGAAVRDDAKVVSAVTPKIGTLAAQLRPQSTIDEMDQPST